MKIQRVLCDYYNSGESSVEATCNYNVSRPIIENPRDFRLTVETAEVSLTQMPLDMDADYIMAIGPWNESSGPLQLFRFPKIIESIEHFLDTFRRIMIVPKSSPEADDGGEMGYFKIDKDSLLSFHIIDEKAWTNRNLYFNKALANILEGFINPLNSQHRWQDVDGKSTRFYSIDSWHATGEGAVNGRKQVSETVSQLVKFKSVRFTTNLPVRPYMVYRQETDTMRSMNILTTVKINSANFDLVNQRNLLYIPNELREIELDSTDEITNFSIGIEIYYSSGHTFVHQLAPGEYFEIALAFKQFNSSNV